MMLTPRSHVRNLGTAFDTLASHSHHVSVLAYMISRMEGLSHAEALEAMAMGVFHDLAEARVGDLDFIHKHYNKADEIRAVKDQFAGIDFAKDLHGLIDQFESVKTKASKCARDADSLAQLYMEWVLMWQGNKLAEKWYKSDFKDRVPNFKTKSAQKLALAMKNSNPHEWWWSQFIKNDQAIDLEKLLGKK